MTKFVINILLVAVLIAYSSADNCVYVINGTAETLSKINIETGEVENHIVTLGVVPNQVVYYNNMLYVVNSGMASLQVINPVNNSIETEIPLPMNSNPWNVVLDGEIAYISGFASSVVYKVNLTSGNVMDTYNVGLSPAGLILHAGKLYVANTGFNPVNFTYGQGSVTVIDLSNGVTVDQVNTGKNPQALAAGPDGMINVICTGDYDLITGKIYFLDPVNNSIIDSISTGGNPYMPVINSSGIGFISAGGWVSSGHIYSYDAVNRVVLRVSNNPIPVGTGAMAVALDSTGMLFSAGQMANSVTQFDSQGTIFNTYPVGSGPVSLTISDTRTSIESATSALPDDVRLCPPYPNPFNSSIVLKYRGNYCNIPEKVIEIFDLKGRLINELNFASNNTINSYVTWQGVDYRGFDVASGVYFARFKGTSGIVKMVLIR